MSAFVFAIVAPAVVSAGIIALVRRARWVGLLADHPNERSLHREPTPRAGGIGVFAGFATAVPFVASSATAPLLAGTALLFLVSLADDMRSLPIQARLVAHAAAAALVVWPATAPQMEMSSLACAAFAIVAIAWMTNLFNFMDGADGIAGGMACIGFGALAFAAWDAGAAPFSGISLAIVSASAGFLVHNFPPARVFLGDAGAIPIGFLAGAVGFLGIEAAIWPVWFPVLVFSPFLVDATVTLASRIVRRERFWRAHRTHYYQRLVLAGWSPRRLALCAYALMLAAAASAVVALRGSALAQFGILLGWATAYASLLVAIDRRAPRADGATNSPGRSAG